MRLLLILTLSFLTACASTTPERSSYLLRSNKNIDSRAVDYKGDAYIGSIMLANYIDQSGLVLVKANGTIHQAKYHEWAEPLRLSLREFFSTEIASHLGHDIPNYAPGEGGSRIDININQLHGNASGEAVLVASWKTGDKAYKFSETASLPEDGYDALAKAEIALLEKLAAAIAASINPG